MANLRVKRVMRRDGGVVRLFRVMWERGTPGDGVGYSAKLSFGLAPRILHWDDGRVTLLGVRVHYQRAYGGIYA